MYENEARLSDGQGERCVAYGEELSADGRTDFVSGSNLSLEGSHRFTGIMSRWEMVHKGVWRQGEVLIEIEPF